MSFPRTTDVAKHPARKPRPVSKLRPQLISVEDVAHTDLQLLTGELSAAARGAQNSLKPGGGQ